MQRQDGDLRRPWEPGPRAKAAFGRALDLVFPPQPLDRGPAAQSGGLSAEAWGRVRFIADPCVTAAGGTSL
jgi:hypothetical protein